MDLFGVRKWKCTLCMACATNPNSSKVIFGIFESNAPCKNPGIANPLLASKSVEVCSQPENKHEIQIDPNTVTIRSTMLNLGLQHILLFTLHQKYKTLF
jgi:hypothetical protein